MQYSWNNVSFQFFNVNVGVGQGLSLFLILSVLYILPVFHILEKHLKNLKIPVSFLSFVDDGLFIAQSKSLTVSNSILFCSYNFVSSILDKFGLVLEHRKIEAFHFSRAQGIFNPPPLNLSNISRLILKPKNTWKYLSFIFNRKLSFYQHIDFYANKAISTVKYMKVLRNSTRNSTRDLISLQKHLLYRSCILPITLYSYQLWFYNRAPLSYPLRVFNQMQQRATIWILSAF